MKDFEAKFISNKPVETYIAVCVDKNKDAVTDMKGTIVDFLAMLATLQERIFILAKKQGLPSDKIMDLFARSSAMAMMGAMMKDEQIKKD